MAHFKKISTYCRPYLQPWRESTNQRAVFRFHFSINFGPTLATTSQEDAKLGLDSNQCHRSQRWPCPTLERREPEARGEDGALVDGLDGGHHFAEEADALLPRLELGVGVGRRRRLVVGTGERVGGVRVGDAPRRLVQGAEDGAVVDGERVARARRERVRGVGVARPAPPLQHLGQRRSDDVVHLRPFQKPRSHPSPQVSESFRSFSEASSKDF